ncbi:MAG: Mur ligase domain-containing protein, partial [Terracidiphilus sp.]
MRWSVVQAAEALGIAAPSGLDPSAVLAGVSIDSRTIQPEELFLAIHGPHHDGHDHVAGALERGASAALVARDRLSQYPEQIRLRLFAVDDTLAALQRLASRACEIWRKRRPGRLIAGVAGSVGKTTTKEILAALVGARLRV